MIKFTATTGDDKRLLGIGLSHTNLERLKEGKPININGQSVGIGGMDVLIFAGKDEATMASQLNEMITAETVIHGGETTTEG